jgi:hypothetical protein
MAKPGQEVKIRGHVEWMSVLCLACSPSPEDWPTPGAETVLEYGRSAGLAWSPLWCRARSGVRPEICYRMLPDSSDIGFQWGSTGRPHQFTHGWDRLSPVRAFDLRDSIRQDLELRGARWIRERAWPVDTKDRLHRRETKWCLDSAVVHVSHSWQEGRPFDFVDFLVGSVPDPGCSTESFRALPRPNPRMQPTGRRGAGRRSGGALR